MSRKHFILLDATLESQANFFAQDPRFQRWLHTYDNIPEALQRISEIPLANSIQVYLARDNIQELVQLPNTNTQPRQLIETFCALRTIQHVSIFTPTINTDLEEQIWNMIPDRRLIKDVISVINLRAYMCLQGIQHLNNEIAHYISTNEIHLITNLRRDIDDLLEYFEELKRDREKILVAMEEEYSNKSGEEPL